MFWCKEKCWDLPKKLLPRDFFIIASKGTTSWLYLYFEDIACRQVCLNLRRRGVLLNQIRRNRLSPAFPDTKDRNRFQDICLPSSVSSDKHNDVSIKRKRSFGVIPKIVEREGLEVHHCDFIIPRVRTLISP